VPARRANPSLTRALALVALLAASACSRKRPDATPEGALRELTERMAGYRGAPGEAKAVYELLSAKAKKNLDGRAERYSAATGKKIQPEAMLAPSHFVPRFQVARMKAETVGSHALVRVVGERPGEVAQVPCVYEDGAWRVDAAMPPLPPVLRLPKTE